MTHIQNIPHILEFGITHKNSPNSNDNFVNIGDISLIGNRNSKSVIANNGDVFDFAADNIRLGDYIPFYFGIKMPMLYVAQHGGNFVERPTIAQNIVYLVCGVKSIIDSGTIYYFSDGHGTDNLTTFYDKRSIINVRNIIDWTALRAGYWSGVENLNLKRKKQAEFLVRNDIPPELIINFGCYNQNAKNQLLNYGISDERIIIVPQAYY